MTFIPYEYKVVKDEISGWSYAWVKTRGWFPRWVGVCYDGTTNPYYPSALWEREIKPAIANHHTRELNKHLGRSMTTTRLVRVEGDATAFRVMMP